MTSIAGNELVPDVIEVDETNLTPDEFEAHSVFSVPISDLTSLRASVLEFHRENGRTYHVMSSGKYQYPNDEIECQRLEIQHNIWLLTLKGEHVLCPYARQEPRRVLDCGTGTGVWAIEYADLHPETQVVGVDLSPIQPSLLPPNCSFIVDDLEKDWSYGAKFDFIFSRVLSGSLASFPDFIQKAWDNLEPGGWLEMQELDVPYVSDDGSLTKDTDVYKLGEISTDASIKIGRILNPINSLAGWIKEAGFINVTEYRDKWPMNPWPKDKHYKEIGAWNLTNMDIGLEGLCMALFTRVQGWTAEETSSFCTVVRQQIRNQTIHAYYPVGIIYAQKPLDAK